MNKEELISELTRLNISEKFYSIESKPKEYAYNLERLDVNKYSVYYLERGEKSLHEIFNNYDEAGNRLLSMIKINLEHGLDLSK